MSQDEIGNRLRNSGLRVTPQRRAVLIALLENKNHPDADSLVRVVREQYPNISVATIYHILDNFAQKGIVNRVLTSRNVVRYDAILEPHIHLYSKEENRIEDFMDDELLALIRLHLEKKRIRNFSVKDINIQLIGEFTPKNK